MAPSTHDHARVVAGRGVLDSTTEGSEQGTYAAERLALAQAERAAVAAWYDGTPNRERTIDLGDPVPRFRPSVVNTCCQASRDSVAGARARRGDGRIGARRRERRLHARVTVIRHGRRSHVVSHDAGRRVRDEGAPPPSRSCSQLARSMSFTNGGWGNCGWDGRWRRSNAPGIIGSRWSAAAC